MQANHFIVRMRKFISRDCLTQGVLFRKQIGFEHQLIESGTTQNYVVCMLIAGVIIIINDFF